MRLNGEPLKNTHPFTNWWGTSSIWPHTSYSSTKIRAGDSKQSTTFNDHHTATPIPNDILSIWGSMEPLKNTHPFTNWWGTSSIWPHTSYSSTKIRARRQQTIDHFSAPGARPTTATTVTKPARRVRQWGGLRRIVAGRLWMAAVHRWMRKWRTFVMGCCCFVCERARAHFFWRHPKNGKECCDSCLCM